MVYNVKPGFENSTLHTTGEGVFDLSKVNQAQLRFLYEECGIRDVIEKKELRHFEQDAETESEEKPRKSKK